MLCDAESEFEVDVDSVDPLTRFKYIHVLQYSHKPLAMDRSRSFLILTSYADAIET